MVGDFMVCVDRIISPTCVNHSAAAAASGTLTAAEKAAGEEGISSVSGDKKGMKMVECRICQEEAEEGELESPCGCSGTLKFAHRKCIQRWCNKKGNITCEICSKVFQPNYSIPPSRSDSDVITIDIRHGWGTRFDLHDTRYLALAAAEQELMRQEYEDYAAASSSGIACCRIVALALMLLLLARHVLMVTRDSGILQDASSFLNVSLLQFVGFLLPCYVIARSCYVSQGRRRRQV